MYHYHYSLIMYVSSLNLPYTKKDQEVGSEAVERCGNCGTERETVVQLVLYVCLFVCILRLFCVSKDLFKSSWNHLCFIAHITIIIIIDIIIHD